MKAAIYYRVSTDRQDLDSQKVAIDSWLSSLPEAKRPTSIVTFEDLGRSGKDTDRPGFTAMLDSAHRGEIDTIIVYRLDRFSRDATTALRTILDLDSKGVAFVSVSQPVLNLGHDNPFRRTMLAAFAEISEIERETIVARVKAGLEAARKAGKTLGRPRGPVSDEQIRELRRQSKTYREISETTGLSLSAVHGRIQSLLNKKRA